MAWAPPDTGLAFPQTYVGCVHATARSIGGLYGGSHGLANVV